MALWVKKGRNAELMNLHCYVLRCLRDLSLSGVNLNLILVQHVRLVRRLIDRACRLCLNGRYRIGMRYDGGGFRFHYRHRGLRPTISWFVIGVVLKSSDEFFGKGEHVMIE
jgi:hypothetical protein